MILFIQEEKLLNYYNNKFKENNNNIPKVVEPVYTNMRGAENDSDDVSFTNDYAAMPVTPERGDSAASVISCICGIISVILCFLPIIPLVIGLIAIFSASGARKNAKINDMPPPGSAIAGKVCGFIGIVLSLTICFFIYLVPILFYEGSNVLNLF